MFVNPVIQLAGKDSPFGSLRATVAGTVGHPWLAAFLKTTGLPSLSSSYNVC